MDSEQQIQELIDGAPQDGTTPSAVRAIAPVLKQIAARLKYPQYYILQTLERHWLVTTLSNQAQPEVEKNVVYAFANRQDASASPIAQQDAQMMALPTPVIHLLFQVLALKTVDSIVFFDTPGNIETGREIQRQEMQDLIQVHLNQTRLHRDSGLPPDIA